MVRLDLAKADILEEAHQLTKFHFSFEAPTYDEFRKYAEAFARDRWF